MDKLSDRVATTSCEISILTPVLNGAKHLAEAIQSVEAQDYPSIEYIVIDGGSTDGTLDIIKQHQDVITAWLSEPDEGVFDAINKGIAMSTGRVVKILNADDLLLPSSVSRAMELFGPPREGMVVASEVDYIDEYGELLKRIDRSRAMNPVGPVLHPSWYAERRIYERLGLYRPEYAVSADFEMFLRFRFAGVPFVYAEAPLVSFRSGGVSTSTFGGVMQRYDIMKRYFPRRVAIAQLARHAFKKSRSRIAIALLGERRTFALRNRLSMAGKDQPPQ